jgi:hypothetical protein
VLVSSGFSLEQDLPPDNLLTVNDSLDVTPIVFAASKATIKIELVKENIVICSVLSN